ncbi:hypothetical protein [Epilithonimonas xixisoli]|nr:hypothetical protein [Epilithonimonas xixisoli]
MMRKNNPELFYLLRRALGILCLLFICKNSFGQIYAHDKQIVFRNKNPKSESASIYIVEGTYVHNFPQTANSGKKKATKPKKRSISVRKKKSTSQKNRTALKHRKKPTVNYRYSSTDKNQLFITSHLHKISFSGSFQDYSNKFLENSTSWNSTKTYSSIRSKGNIKSFKEDINGFFNDFKVRPPPACLAI